MNEAPFCAVYTVHSLEFCPLLSATYFQLMNCIISFLEDTFEKIPFICLLINGLITARIVVSRDQHAFWLREVKLAENVRE